MKVKIPLSDVAIERRENYRTVYDLALRGDLGPVVRERGRLFIVREEAPVSAEEPFTQSPSVV